MADTDIDDTDDIADEHDGNNGNGYAADPHTLGLMIAVTWCRVANNKALERTIKKMDRLDRKYADTQDKLASLTAQAAELETVLTQRAAELDRRQAENERRETEFENQAQDVRDELREHHARLEQMHRQLVHRIMATTGITGNWNFDLQGVPSWEQLKRQIADLPDDLPAPTAEVISENVRQDWVGHTFVPGSSLTRTVRGAA
jgi:hypothetical protein